MVRDDDPPEVRAGLFGTVAQVIVHPRRFFEPGKPPPTRVGPLTFIVLIYAVDLGTEGLMQVGGGATGAVTTALGRAVVGAIVAVPLLLVSAGICHVFVRLLRGRGTFGDTRSVLAFASAPLLFTSIPWVGPFIGLWSPVLGVIGLSRTHSLGIGRAIFVLLSPVLGAVALALALRVFVLEAYKIPSGAMAPSLQIGDHIFALKSAYGVFSHGAPARGDVIVFESPEEREQGRTVDYVMRVVGLPGDEVRVEDGHPIINGRVVPSCDVAKVHNVPSLEPPWPGEFYIEVLGNTRFFVFLESGHVRRTEGPFRVAPGEVFVMGDNRNNAYDSRVWFGGRGRGVPFGFILGRAAGRWLPLNRGAFSVSEPRAEDVGYPSLAPRIAQCLRAIEGHAP